MKLEAGLLRRTVWFLDYDGSVCPHQEVWEERIYDPVEIFDVVSGLRAGAAGMFWNTGRRVESLGGVHPGFLGFPGYFIQGSCFWKPGSQGDSSKGTKELIGPLVPDSLQKAAAEFVNIHPEFKLEVKPTSLRLTPYHGHSLFQLDAALASLRPQTPREWHWLVGNRGAELLAKGYDKATAVRREMSRLSSDLIPVAVGDDILDRPAIEECLRRGGFAIIVGEGCGWVTEIQHRMDQLVYCEDPRKVLELIASLSASV